MNLDQPKNPNYAATVIEVKTLVPAQNADRLQIIPVFGLQAIVDLNTKVGDIGILLPAECRLSEKMVYFNNLATHGNLNVDPSKKGYIEDNRRVRAIRLRGNRSDAIFLPLESLIWAGNPYDLKVGDTFDTFNGEEICRKHAREPRVGNSMQAKIRQSRVDEKMFPEHFETPQWYRNLDIIEANADAHAIVTQKLHGTSVRIGNVPVERKLTWLERVARRFGAKVHDTEYSMVYGSHHVIKDANNPGQQHYYDQDVWTVEGQKLDGIVPENYILYGEIVGFTDNGAPIQKHYTYECEPHSPLPSWEQSASRNRKLYIYRIAVINNHGLKVDLGWEAVKEFCHSIGVEHVPELWKGPASWLLDGSGMYPVSRWLDVKLKDTYEQAVGLSYDSPCDEGVVIRIDAGMQPWVAKAKSPTFLQHETQMFDENVADIEETGEEEVFIGYNEDILDEVPS